MLVHKQSRGVLQSITEMTEPENKTLSLVWTPKSNLKLRMFPDLDPEEWWEISDNSTVGRKALLHYPNFEPVIGDKGELLDVIPIQDKGEKQEETAEKPNRRNRRRSICQALIR